jgi:Family of unknown function (DUF6527)
MTPDAMLSHEFVEFIPDNLEERTLYVCVGLATVVHKCCCGCGSEVVTPLSPTDWKLTFDGETITLHPSIGNWSFKCQSHYWIRNNKVNWADRWSQEEIAAGRAHDRKAKEKYFSPAPVEVVRKDTPEAAMPGKKVKPSLWRKLKDRLR